MSYLDKLKASQLPSPEASKDIQVTKETNNTKKASGTLQSPKNKLRNNPVESVPPLPWQLERLIRAATVGSLPDGAHTLESGVIYDLNRYTLSWAAAYLLGDRGHCLVRLWQAYKAWQPDKEVN